MYQRKLVNQQLLQLGVRIGDSCNIQPFYGHKKAFTLNTKKLDLVSSDYRPKDLALSFFELPRTDIGTFHYRLELDSPQEDAGRFILKTIKGEPFRINGLAAREAYIERMDRLFIDDHKIQFSPYDLGESIKRYQEHPILVEHNLICSNLKILLTGETGTGKSFLARKIHEKSLIRGSFISLNLAAFNSNLIESELFGHKKGSFTGAINDKVGAFQQAQNGTLFLDEIDSLPYELQTKLLTFLDDNMFRRVGDTQEIKINTRLIFASGSSLEKLVDQGKFRKDLYFRLKSGASYHLESLRDAPGRVGELCEKFSITHHISLTPRLIEFYQTLAWPGNIRQLLGHLEKKKVLSKSTKLDFDEFDEELLLQSSNLLSLNLDQEIYPIQTIKKNYTKKVYGACEGNLTMTAKKLGMSEKTIKALLREV
jgi:transcriptional regulator of acetoin/glycerol metabolism